MCVTPILLSSGYSDHDKIYSDFPEVFAIPDDETSRGEHFYAEAERLWNAEEGRASLANIQAVALMSRLYGFCKETPFFFFYTTKSGQTLTS